MPNLAKNLGQTLKIKVETLRGKNIKEREKDPSIRSTSKNTQQMRERKNLHQLERMKHKEDRRCGYVDKVK